MPTGTPTYITIDAQGRVGANFTGKVHAQELDLDANPVTPPIAGPIMLPPQYSINWVNADGGQAAQIEASQSPFSALLLNAPAKSDVDAGRIVLAATPFSNANQREARLTVDKGPVVGGGGITVTTVAANGQTQSETILDDLGNSSFLRKLSSGASKIAIGINSCIFPGGIVPSNITTVPHGLGRTPLCVLITPAPNANETVFGYVAGFPDATNFKVQLGFTGSSFPANSSRSFYWAAIG